MQISQISLQNGIRLFHFYFTQLEWESETMTITSRQQDNTKVFGVRFLFPLSSDTIIFVVGRGIKFFPKAPRGIVKLLKVRMMILKSHYIFICDASCNNFTQEECIVRILFDIQQTQQIFCNLKFLKDSVQQIAYVIELI